MTCTFNERYEGPNWFRQLVLSGLNQEVTLACSVGLVDHRLHDSPPGVDEPAEEQEVGSDVTVGNSSKYETSEMISEALEK